MIRKQFITDNERKIVQVTFTIPSCKWSNTIHWVGDFNHWNHFTHPFQRDHNGDRSITLEMTIDQIYQFRYLCDGREWMNDSSADGYVPNRLGSENCLLVTKADFKPHTDEL